MVKWSDDTIFSVRQGHSIDETPRVEAPPRMSLELGRHGLELMLRCCRAAGARRDGITNQSVIPAFCPSLTWTLSEIPRDNSC
jgi:hypothetical protein